MRELIYLSRRKLDQFQRDASTGRRRRRIRGVGATAPMSLGGFQVTLADQGAAEQPTLVDVIDHIDNDEQPARWWNDPEVRSGEWVRFDTELSFMAWSNPDEWPSFEQLYRDGRVSMPTPMALFWDVKPPRGAVRHRLMLHGSPEHLIGARPITTMSEVTASSVGFWSSFPAEMARFVSQLADGSLNAGARSILRHLDHCYLQQLIAARMIGYARISFIIDAPGFNAETQRRESYRIVVASPLVVEYARGTT